MTKIFFAHSAGAQDGPGRGSYDLVAALRKKLPDFSIHCPLIADPENPTYDLWKKMFDREFALIKSPLILIGHSLGGSMLLKYFSEEKPGMDVTALFMVAIPAWGKSYWDVDEFVLKPAFQKEISIPHLYFYHCQNDPVVPIRHLDFYKHAFDNATIREMSCADHVFSNGLPELAQDLADMAAH